jgi:hypothetical protein
MVSVEDAALAAMFSEAAAVPAAVGSKVTENVQKELAASVEPQVLDWE